MQIPIENIYYLLSYAWDKLEEGNKIKVSSENYKTTLELYSRVLINGINHLFKRGLDTNFINLTNEYIGIKGKIDFGASLNKNLFKQGRTICSFDVLELNILQNQILKATIKRLLSIDSIDSSLKIELKQLYLKLSSIDDIQINKTFFKQIHIHRNNALYDLILHICKLIYESTFINQKEGKYYFKEFIGNEKQMASLFEAFIRNYYKKEQSDFVVHREDIKWDALPIDNSSISYLPKMQTDISLESKNRKIIIETKYYSETLSSRFEKSKFNSNNLYQIYSYLNNLQSQNQYPKNYSLEGILLYPTINISLNEKFMFGNHKITIRTIDLSKPWQEIQNSLNELILS